MKQKDKEKKKAWKEEDLAIRGDIARYLAMSNQSVASLGELLGVSKTTMYARINRPETLTLQEYRVLKSLFSNLGF